MNDARRTKADLIQELRHLRARVRALELDVALGGTTAGDEENNVSSLSPEDKLSRAAEEWTRDATGKASQINSSRVGLSSCLDTFHALFAVIHQARGLQQLWEEALIFARTRLGCPRLSIWLKDPERNLLSCAAWVSATGSVKIDKSRKVPVKGVIAGFMEYGQPLDQMHALSSESPLLPWSESGTPYAAVLCDGDERVGLLVVDCSHFEEQAQSVEMKVLLCFARVIAQQYARIRLLEEKNQDHLQIQEIMNHRGVVAYRMDCSQGVFDYLGSGIESLIGESVEHVAQRGVSFYEALIHPEDRRHFSSDSWTGSLSSSDSENRGMVEYRLVKASGEIVWVQDEFIHYRDPVKNASFRAGMLYDITDRKKAQSQIVEERNLLRTLIDTLPDQIYVKDRNSRFKLANAAVMSVFDVSSADEIIGRSDADFYEPDRARDYFLEEQKLMASGNSMLSEPQHGDHGSGFEDWALVSKVPLFDGQGKVTGLVGINRSISKQKAIENALRESEERYRLLLDASPDGVLVVDEQGSCLLANQTLADLLGFKSPDELIGKNCAELVVAEEVPKVQTNLQRILSEGRLQSQEYRLRHKDGSILEVEVNAATVKQGDGASSEVFGVIRDRTERRRILDKLEKSEELLRRTTRSLPIAFFSAEGQTNKTLLFEGAVEQLFGCSEAALQEDDSAVRELVYPPDSYYIYETFHQGLRSGKPFDLTYRIRHARTGKLVWIQQFVVPLLDEQGHVLRHDSVLIDVSRHKQTQSQLEAQRATLRAILDASMDSIILVDRECVVLDANHAATDQFGIVRGDLVGSRLTDLLSSEHSQLIEERIASILESRQAWSGTEEISGRWLETNLIPLLTRKGEVERILVFTRDVTLQRAEEQHMRFLSAAVSQSFEGVVIIDDNGYILFANEACARMHQREVSEMVGEHLAIMHSSRQMEAYGRNFERLRTEGSFQVEMGHVRRDGEEFPTLMSCSAIRDEQGRIRGYLGAILDITELKRVETELLESQQRYRSMLDALPVVTYTASAEPAEFVLVDGAVEQLTGYPKEDFLDDYSLSSRVLHPDDRAHALSQYESGLAEGKTFEIEFRIIHRNGGVRWVHTCVVPELNEAGQLLLHHGVITDTTARKDAEARSHRLLTAIENAGEGVGVWSHNWKLEYGNTALVNLLGSQSIQHALRIRDDTHPSTTQAAMTLEEVTEQLQQAGHWRGRLVIPQEDGKHLICDATFSRVGPADGAQLIVGNLRDQTAQENYIQQIRSLSLSNEELLEEERKRISRELHDELGQILTAMKINLKWIGNAVADAPAPAVERLQECQDLTQRMVDGVRDMVRSLRPAVLTEGTLEDALAAMVGDFRANTGVGCLLTSRIEKVQVSPQLAGVIYRVVQEALTNVARHAQASFCRVRLHSEGDHVILSVEDNGRGLDPEDLVTGQSKGLIGMRERVEAVGGTLKVSACRGQGLCVVAELPVSPVEGGSTLS